jgi:23S rRNA (uracil1939-C5)-methyltransferase
MSETAAPESFAGRVRALSSEGYGVVEDPAGRVFFVPGTWPGDEGVFQVRSLKKRYGYARLQELRQPSADRVQPPCPHQGMKAGACGGCAWMIGSYESQLAAKQGRVEHALKRAGFDTAAVLHPIWGSPSEFGYRNRAQFKTDGERIGFVSEGSRKIAPVEDCLVLNEKNRATLASLRAKLPEPAWAPQPPHDWNFIDIDDAIGPEEVVLNRRRPFRQGNTAQNERMRAWLGERLAPLARERHVLELFAGSGNFTEVASGLGFAKITAVEVQGPAIEALRTRGLPGVRPLGWDLYGGRAWAGLKAECPDAGVLVLDPPREGLLRRRALLEEFPSLTTALYVSCDLATWVRDICEFRKHGWELREVQPLDQFPHTPHVEILSRLERAIP